MSSITHDLTQHWYIYVAMPLVAAAIGYVTKLVAVEMLFRPVEFKGIKPFLGWQGIIPHNAARMARVAVDTMMDRLLDPQELMDRIDVTDMRVQLHDPMMQIVDEMTREIMIKYRPLIWESMPEAIRKVMIWNIKRTVPATLDRMMDDMRTNIDSVIDIRQMAFDALVRDKVLLVKLIRTLGRNEMRFIVRVGIPFGFILGLVQAGVWALTHSAWIMPAFGGMTGLVTDYLALQMIFRPIHPKRYFGVVRWQGLFHKRRAEVTEDYSRLITDEIMNPANMLEALLSGPQSDRFLDVVSREIQHTVDQQSGIARPIVVALVGGANYRELKRDAVAGVVKRMRSQPTELTEYATNALDLPALITSKMVLMTDEEYESLLRPAFKQDEWKLIVVGAVLGFLIGELQVHVLLT